MAVVGIDLGTTNTVVATVRGGRAIAVKDKAGRALLPSVVSFHPSGQVLVGADAKLRRTVDAPNTVFSVKRLIGRSWDSTEVQQARERFPFELREGPGKSALVRARGASYTLPEISARVLEQAKLIAETALATEVDSAVITVPANFNDLQRAATKVAGRTAGLEVLRILNEPTAAALAYGLGKAKRERIVVYDFGGGTFDVTLLDLNDNVFEVLATAGDTFLGGDDIDRAIAEVMAEGLLEKHRIDARADRQVFEKLRAAAEEVKIHLSSRPIASIVVEEVGHGLFGKAVHFDFTMTRAELDSLADPLIEKTLKVCTESLELAGLKTTDFDRLLLVGGSTRLPLVRQKVAEYFSDLPRGGPNPDEVVALGAAIQASALGGTQKPSHVPSAPRPAALDPASGTPARARMASIPPDTGPGPRPSLRSRPPSGRPSTSSRPQTSHPRSEPSVLARLEPAPTTKLGMGTAVSGAPTPRRQPPGAPLPVTSGSPSTLLGMGGQAAPSIESLKGKSPPARKRPPPPFPRAAPAAHRDPSEDEDEATEEVDFGSLISDDETTGRFELDAFALETIDDTEPESGDTQPDNDATTDPHGFDEQDLEASAPEHESATIPRGLDPIESDLPAPTAAIPPPASAMATTLASPGVKPPEFLQPTPHPAVTLPSQRPLLLDVTPLALGVEVVGGYCDELIPRNSPIPCEQTRPFTTARDDQTIVRVRVSQGQERAFQKNTLLGEVILTGLDAAPRGAVVVDVTFALDESGILNVSARDASSGSQANAQLRLVGVAEAS